MINFEKVKKSGWSVNNAAKYYGVPYESLLREC